MRIKRMYHTGVSYNFKIAPVADTRVEIGEISSSFMPKMRLCTTTTAPTDTGEVSRATMSTTMLEVELWGLAKVPEENVREILAILPHD